MGGCVSGVRGLPVYNKDPAAEPERAPSRATIVAQDPPLWGQVASGAFWGPMDSRADRRSVLGFPQPWGPPAVMVIEPPSPSAPVMPRDHLLKDVGSFGRPIKINFQVPERLFRLFSHTLEEIVVVRSHKA